MQFVLGALLFFVVPKSKVPGFKRSLTPDTFSQAAVEMDNIPEGVGSEVFCIVFDAGSTGERTAAHRHSELPQHHAGLGVTNLRCCVHARHTCRNHASHDPMHTECTKPQQDLSGSAL